MYLYLIRFFLFACFSLNYFLVFSQSKFNPSNITGLKIWLRSDTGLTLNGDTVSQWNDISGNSNNALQTNGVNKPLRITSDTLLNNYPVIRFNGVNFKLETNYAQPKKYSVFIVYAHRTGDQGSFYGTTTSGYPLQRNTAVWPNSDVANYLLSDEINVRNIYEDIFDFQNSNFITYLNGTKRGGFNNIISNSGGLMTIGFASNELLNGSIAEFILYDNALPDSSRLMVEKYLMNRYAPPVNLGKDITMTTLCDTVLKVGKRFTSFLWNTGATTESVTINKSGTYVVTVNDIFGRTSSDTIKIFYPFNQLSKSYSVCYGDTVFWNTNLPSAGNYSFQWSNGASTSNLQITQTGTYSVSVTNLTSGCILKSDTVHVSINNFSQTTSLGSDKAICSGEQLYLSNGAEEVTSYIWSTGATTSSIAITSAGTYSVTVQDSMGCIAKDTINVSIKGVAPSPDFKVNSICQNSQALFSDLTDVPPPDGIAAWSWNFGDGGIASSQNPLHTYISPGSYTTALSVVSDSGCTAVVQKSVTVNPIPFAQYTIISSPQCTENNTQFMDASSIPSGSMTGWNWNFGDGSNSAVKNPVHTYSAAGTYSIQFMVTSALGCIDTLDSAITVSQSPTALFITDSVCQGNLTTFIDKSAGSITNWLWSFGDGSSAAINNVTHTYLTAGTYSVYLQVTTSNGCVNSIINTVPVYDLPTSYFTGTNACMGSPMQLLDNSTVIGSIINKWYWKFGGNGGTSTLQNPVPVFSAAGTYSVDLTVTSEQGCAATATQTVSVKPLPVANFSMTPTYISFPNQPVNFSNLTLDALVYHWYFGDGKEDSILNPLHVYQDTGVYAIVLKTITSFGCVDSITRTMSVDIPLLDIRLSDMFATKSSNSLQVSILLKNTGTIDVKNMELSAYLDDGTPVHEFWYGLLRPDSFIIYSFHSSFELNTAHSIVCVVVKSVNGQNDAISANNKKCNAITDEFTLLNPFPNPTNDIIYFLYITPEEVSVKAQVYDSRGRLVDNLFDGNSVVGINQLNFNTTKLEQGVYVFKITCNNKIVTKKFMKR